MGRVARLPSGPNASAYTDPETYSDLIGAIYDAALDHALWPAVLERIARFVDGRAAGLLSKDSVSKLGDIHYNWGISEHYVRLYRDTHWKFDPLTPLLFSDVGEVTGRMDFVDDAEFREGRFYREWVAPQGLVDAANVVLEKSATSFAILSVVRGEEHGQVDAAMRHRVGLLAPHLRRSVLIGRVIDLNAAQAADFSELIDGLAASVFLLGADGRVIHTNAAGHELLRDGTLVQLRGGRLSATDRNSHDALIDALQAAGGGDVALGTRGIALPLLSRSGERFAVNVLPMRSSRRSLVAAGQGAVAAIFIHRAAQEIPTQPEVIAQTFRLTPAELRVLLGIVEIGGVSETAEALGIGEATVKTHLHRLFGKTGTSRQADLVKLMAAYSSPLARQ